MSFPWEKLNLIDKDERNMAFNDLKAALLRDDFRFLDDEHKCVAAVLKNMEDSSIDIKQQALKCVAILIKRSGPTGRKDLSERISANALSKDSELRDIASIGIKEIITALSQQDAALFYSAAGNNLVNGLSQGDDIANVAVDLFNDTLKKFGTQLSREYTRFQTSLLPLMKSAAAPVRSRAVKAIASLAALLNPQQFAALINELFSTFSSAKKKEELRTFVQALAAISLTVGHRLGSQLNRIVGLFVGYLQDESHEEDIELLNSCLQAFDSFTGRCPGQIGEHLPVIVAECNRLLPYQDVDFLAEAEEEDDDEGDDDMSDDDNDFDDETSWKVRLSAVRCLSTIVRTRRDGLEQIAAVLPAIVSRFNEFNERVRLEVFDCFETIVRSVKHNYSERAAVFLTDDILTKVFKTISKQLKQKNNKTRDKSFEVLRATVRAAGPLVTPHLDSLVAMFNRAVSDKSAGSTLKAASLSFLRYLILSQVGAVFHPYAKSVTAPLKEAVSDSTDRVCSQGLRAVSTLVISLRPDLSEPPQADHVDLVAQIFASLKHRFVDRDIDTAVRDFAIEAMGQVLARFGSIMEAQKAEAMPTFLNHLSNASSRLATLQALNCIAEAKCPIQQWISDLTFETAKFLSSREPSLTQAALQVLTTFVVSYAASFTSRDFDEVLSPFKPLILDSQSSQLALGLSSVVVRHHGGKAAGPVETVLIPAVFEGVLSPSCSDSAVNDFFEAIKQTSPTLVPRLTEQLMAPVVQGSVLGSKQLRVTAHCVAVLVEQAEMSKFVKDASSTNPQLAALSLYCIGAFGRRSNLASLSLEKVLLSSLDSEFEEVKTAASDAFGGVTVGNLETFLPLLLNEITSQPRHQYHAFSALREVFSHIPSASSLEPFLPSLLRMFSAQSSNEAAASMVADCYGRLAAAYPEAVIKDLTALSVSTSPVARATAINALRSAFQLAQSQTFVSILPSFLAALQDSELIVIRAALALSQTAVLHGGIDCSTTPDFFKLICGHAQYKETFLRTMQLGVLTEKIDDGLELRKLAFSCIGSIMDKKDKCFDPQLALSLVEATLVHEKEDKSVLIMAHNVLRKLVAKHFSIVLGALDTIAEAMEKTLKTPEKEKAKGGELLLQYIECCRATFAMLSKIEEVHHLPRLSAIFSELKMSKEFDFEELCSDAPVLLKREGSGDL